MQCISTPGMRLIVAVYALAWFGTPALANFYEVRASDLAGQPGEIIRAEKIAGAPGGALGYRVLYRSTGLNGEPIPVSGVVAIPAGRAPARGRDVIAWAHPTTGVVPPCAPSLSANVFATIPGLEGMLTQGYVVTATDYPGLGTAGPHPYLVGVSEGRAVLDSVRAARALAEAEAGHRFAVWGHSQGGHAALFAGEILRSYAPELELVGIAVAAPATELVDLLEADLGTMNGKILTALALWSWSKIYGAALEDIIYPHAVPAFERVAQDCIESVPQVLALRLAAWALRREFLKVDPAEVEPWRSFMARNTPGQVPPGIPVFIAQGTADVIVHPAITHQFMDILCRHGTTVRFVSLLGVIHAFAGRDGATAAVQWMTDRFNGAPPPNDCGTR